MSARTDTEAVDNANATGVTISSLKFALVQKLEATRVDIEDMSGKSLVWTASYLPQLIAP